MSFYQKCVQIKQHYILVVDLEKHFVAHHHTILVWFQYYQDHKEQMHVYYLMLKDLANVEESKFTNEELVPYISFPATPAVLPSNVNVRFVKL